MQSKRLSDGAPVTLAATVDVPTYGGLEDWYGLSINSASNETVEVTDEGDCFCVNFRRFGHGIGMSARGAQAMARDYGMGGVRRRGRHGLCGRTTAPVRRCDGRIRLREG